MPTPANAIQSDMIIVVYYITRILPFMMDAIVNLDLEKVKDYSNAMRGVLVGMDILLNLEKQAHSRFTELVAKGPEGVWEIENDYVKIVL